MSHIDAFVFVSILKHTARYNIFFKIIYRSRIYNQTKHKQSEFIEFQYQMCVFLNFN